MERGLLQALPLSPPPKNLDSPVNGAVSFYSLPFPPLHLPLMQVCPIKRQPAGLPFVLPALWFTMQATEVHGTPTLAPGATVIGYPSLAT